MPYILGSVAIDIGEITVRTPSPKLEASDIGNQRTWYRYYAGFSPRFVAAALDHLEAGDSRSINLIDPWCGAGTAPTVAAQKGHNAVGIDINPALVVVSRARHANTDDIDRAIWAVSSFEGSPQTDDVHQDDPLCAWFSPRSVAAVRHIQHSYNAAHSVRSPSALEDELPHDAGWCVLHLALFRYIRETLPKDCVRNPTWTKTISKPAERMYIRRKHIVRGILDHLRLIREKLCTENSHSSQVALPSYHRGSSMSLPCKDETFDAVITSPPYCTRVDYVRATFSELACIYQGATGWHAIRDLDMEMIGVTRLGDKEAPSIREFATTSVSSLMDRVYLHPSKASKTYYWKYFALYFDSLKRSMEEIARVTRIDGSVIIVVQGSFYKEIFIDLPRLVTEYAECAGLDLVASAAYDSRWDFGRVNPKTQPNRSESVKEVVLHFYKRR